MNRTSMRPAVLALFCIAALASACFPPRTNPTASPLALTVVVKTAVVSPVATPAPAGAEPAATAAPAAIAGEPEPGMARITGRLKVSEQFLGIIGEIFLAKAVPTSRPDVFMPSLDTTVDPRADLNRTTWEFVFANVPPGKYALVIWEPFHSELVEDAASRQTLFIDVVADETLDLGVIPIGPQP